MEWWYGVSDRESGLDCNVVVVVSWFVLPWLGGKNGPSRGEVHILVQVVDSSPGILSTSRLELGLDDRRGILHQPLSSCCESADPDLATVLEKGGQDVSGPDLLGLAFQHRG